MRLLTAVLLLSGALIVALPAAAQRGPHDAGARRGAMQQERVREGGREHRPRHALTPDERRELQRDLREADREIYRKRREAGRRR